MRRRQLWTATLSVAVASSGCGYRLVRHPELAVQRIARDSVTISELHDRLMVLSLQWRADSLRLENELAQQRAAAEAIVVPPPPPPPDSLLKARAVEIASLKEQLAKVSAELDRIKRRLANPRG